MAPLHSPCQVDSFDPSSSIANPKSASLTTASLVLLDNSRFSGYEGRVGDSVSAHDNHQYLEVSVDDVVLVAIVNTFQYLLHT